MTSRRAPEERGDTDGILRRYFRREPKQSRSRALVAAVLDAADELIRGGAPIDAVTVERVSERAGVGMGSFYEYFTSKTSLVGVLIGKVTRSNFEDLARKLEDAPGDSLEAVVRAFAGCIVETYLAHPNRTRVLTEGVGRLGLSTLVHEEKDRFATVMATRAAPYLPGEPLGAIEATMRFVADAAMGVIVFTAMRGDDVDQPRLAAELAAMSIETIRRRHKPEEAAGDFGKMR